ncbi:Sensory/regulatory protein RpfC [Fundidesulfovibrio magnetotacticus]|uniref:histidine kinase n=1 Tax=Fundidesulfovibrio magnetotacticus TaxID=2730080 RepID=A0A6V8LV15_9BACT|nr:response regulator [Fundidesulfovibrio magnetotacticus]GFK94158.1 Sensory/regulatory protein RpfC [Fundidesulfovibrio magnetotacticus]
MDLPRGLSLQARTILLVTLLSGAAALTALGVARHETAQILSAQSAERAVQALSQASLLVNERNEDILDQRRDAVDNLRSLHRTFLKLFTGFIDQERERGVQRERAADAALQSLSGAAREAGVSLFVLDSAGVFTVHTTPGLAGSSWSRLWPSGARPGPGAAPQPMESMVVWWPDGEAAQNSKQLASLVRYEPWGWTLGVSTAFERIENRSLELAAQMDQEIQGALSDVRFGRDGRLFLLAREGQETLLVPPRFKALLDAHAREIAQAASPAGAPARLRFIGPWGDATVFTSYLPHADRTLGLVLDTAELRGDTNGLDGGFHAALAALVTAGAFLAWRFTRRVAGPLGELSRLAERASPAHPSNAAQAGARRHELDRLAGAPREAGALARTLRDALHAQENAALGREQAQTEARTAAERLAAVTKDLDTLKQDLEHRVALRTAALEAANHRLHRSEARFRSLFVASPVPFLELDARPLIQFLGSPEAARARGSLDLVGPELLLDCLRLLRIQDANPAALAFFGASGMDGLTRTLPEVLAPVADISLDRLRDVLLIGPIPQVMCRIRTPSGLLRHAVAGVRPMPGHEQSRDRLLVSLQDVTRLYESEERLRAAHDRLQAANRAKSEFLANMSHEIRTPLTAILGLAELSTRQTGQERTAQHMRMIADSAQTLLDIVGDVLDLSRVEAGKLVLDRKLLRPRDVLDKAMAPHLLRAGAKGLEFSAQVAPDVPDTLLGDPLRLGQVLSNLMDNAVKFTPKGAVRVNLVVADRRATDVTLGFSVQDTGIGIAPESMDTIFDNFRQADSSFSKAYQGAGLGLAICRELTLLMGGDISVESVQGQGSTFRFTAVLEQTDRKTSETAVASPPTEARTTGLRVLVAEDNPHNRHVYREFLASQGHRVETAADGEQALDLLRKQPFDLVLMDVQMPRMDGLEAVRSLRDGACGEEASRTPVLALTAYAMRGDRERFLLAGMTDYLPKPVSLDDLAKAVDRLGGAPPAPEAARSEQAVFDRNTLEQTALFLAERCAQARAHLNQGDLEGVAKAAHDVKGTAMLFRFAAVNEAGARLHEAARDGNPELAREAMDGLDEALADFRRELGWRPVG